MIVLLEYYLTLDPSLDASEAALELTYLDLDLLIIVLLSDRFNNLLFSSNLESIRDWNFSLNAMSSLAFCLSSYL